MPTSLQAAKRLRQNKKARLRNKACKSDIHSLIRKLDRVAESGDAQGAASELRNIYSKLDKAAKTRVIPKNRANRKKSRLAKKLARGQGPAREARSQQSSG